MLHGQSFHLGGLLLAEGFALGLGPGFPTLIGLAVSLSLSLLGGGRRRGGWLALGRRCSHGRTPRTRKGKGIGGQGPRQCVGEVAVTNHKSLLQTGTTDRGRSPWIGVTSDEAETLPDSESHTGKTQGV